MCKYRYLPKISAPIKEMREYKLNKLFGKKAKTPPIFPNVNPKSVEHRERLEVFNYFKKLGHDEDFIQNHWWFVYNEKYKHGKEYKKKPKRERKDNQNPKTNTINWNGGGGGYSSIRVPSKKRKNKWKNFKKMFPKYCEDKNIK